MGVKWIAPGDTDIDRQHRGEIIVINISFSSQHHSNPKTLYSQTQQRSMSTFCYALKVPYYEKHVFSGLYISWSSLSLPTPRIRKANKSCMVSAAQPLVKRRSNRLFRFCSFRYITIVRPPLCGDRSYPRGGCPPPRWSLVCPVVS